MIINEAFLYYIWKFKLWSKGTPLLSTQGESIEVISPGERNEHAGPDFINAKLKINGILWAGNVEIHVKSSDWILHNHQQDKNYQNIILHIVFEDDYQESLGKFSTLELKKYLPNAIIGKYQNLQENFDFIPCEKFMGDLDDFYLKTFTERLFIDRLQQKSEQLNQRLQYLKGDWEALLFEELSYIFGLKINAEPMRLLAKSFPFQVLRANHGEAEALLLGQAGFLEEPQDDYSIALKKSYDFIRHKHQLSPVSNHLFKFLRLRPPSFPTLRIAQLAGIYRETHQMFSLLQSARNLKEFYTIFERFSTSEYWDNHYKIGVESKRKTTKKISKSLIHLILINVWYPILFLFEKNQADFDVEKFLEAYAEIPAEENSILLNFRNLGIEIENAQDSQALLELKKSFCNHKKCLSCNIGNQVLKSC
ncbi:DUF2851 family protein [Ornithobacterium rhinotracheale]|uniref:DUF2851 family protein n=2 Tax=Ornithobacterium rhinotracheale TaxID=28251 RepID=I3ZXP2_ORNRL|nr:DUF2851 family protein [Ornithobacterium rhinotracheale]AFL96476.1 Protein of unknown function (DUF2851) [Ornithobacterium rhinotracheale DSM 15997]AIP98683.1 hypothetical protein Q785_01390 [Ornithobacterium rhinotracheale ORT-UMN 88]KGB67829.1 hypothetical protein Q787_01355 [Ornithobacterium rhinotracheale H06-030791]MCK0194804.1 DUF2851 family protein [Ornithobacterium rhinotracheale]UOH62952.1 DUF2851 family protein [Ornithobacterium rhinotracheale]